MSSLINLESLLSSQLDKNFLVCQLNGFEMEESTFSNLYGGICQGKEGFVLLEESLDQAFDMSEIEVVELSEKRMFLRQANEEYEVFLCIKNGDILIDFESLELVG